MYHPSNAESSSKCRQHIDRLFDERGRNDPNSTTLANTLNKDVETVFNSVEKFVFELLQNADDAGLPDSGVDMCFTVRTNYLLFSHNGKHFDEVDVEAICDNAQRRKRGKELDLGKTGYKGIGFKSVFVISDCVCIFSQRYTFRFDRNFSKWNQASEQNIDSRYPWQIVPIWTPGDELPPGISFDHKAVNFLLMLREGAKVNEALSTIMSNPQIALFLRRTNSITVDLYGEIHRLRIVRDKDIRAVYVNEALKGRWLISEKTLDIPSRVHDMIKHMGAHECPEKIKQAQHISITFGAKLNSHGIIEASRTPLFCYLPTTIDYGFPFLVNADFLLSADRTHLLNNGWNNYLFGEIGRLHIHWLQELAECDATRDQVLLLLKRVIMTDSFERPPLKEVYQSNVESTLKSVSFVPAYDAFGASRHSASTPSGVPRQLLLADAVSDDLDFFKTFPGIDADSEVGLARYELEARNKIPRHFDRRALLERLEGYFSSARSIELQKRLLRYLMDKYPQAGRSAGRLLVRQVGMNRIGSSRSAMGGHYVSNDDAHPLTSELSEKRFILTKQGGFAPPKAIRMPAKEMTAIPSFLKLELLHDDLFEFAGLREWLLALGAQEANVKNLFEDIFGSIGWVGNVSQNDSLEIITFVYYALQNSSLSPYDLKRLKDLNLLTASGTMKPAKRCYLPSTLHPKIDLQKFVERAELFLSDRYLLTGMDGKKLGEVFRRMGVKDSVSVHYESHFDLSSYKDRLTIDYYSKYLNFLERSNSVDFFGNQRVMNKMLYFDFLHCLATSERYAIFFWKTIDKDWEKISGEYADTTIDVRSKKRSKTFNGITPYIVYFISEIPCIRAEDGQLYKSTQLYNFSVLNRLGPRLAQIFPRMQARFETNSGVFELQFSDEKATFFRFRKNILSDDCLKLLGMAERDDERNRLENYTRILSIISSQPFNEATRKKLREADVRLLAADSSLRPASSLYFYRGQTTMREMATSAFLKVLTDFNEDQMEGVSRLFGVSILHSEDMKVRPRGLQRDMNIKARILQAIPLWAVITAKNERKDKEELCVGWRDCLEKLEIFTAESVNIVSPINAQLRLFLKIFSLDNKIYYVNQGRRSEDDLLEEVIKHLDITEKTRGDILKTFSYSEPERVEWLRDCGLDHRFLAEASGVTSRTSRREGGATKIAREGEPIDEDISFDLQDEDSIAERALQAEDNRSFNVDLSLDQGSTFLQPTHSAPPTFPSTIAAASVNFIPQKLPSILPPAQPSPLPSGAGKRKMETIGESDGGRGNDHSAPSVDPAWVGRRGEEMVYMKLLDHYRTKYSFCEMKTTTEGFALSGRVHAEHFIDLQVAWRNKLQESGEAFDIEITKNGQVRYVEVKSTSHPSGFNARVSRNEWEKMRTARNRYRIFCVYNAGQEQDVRIAKIKDPAGQLYSGRLQPKEIQFRL